MKLQPHYRLGVLVSLLCTANAGPGDKQTIYGECEKDSDCEDTSKGLPLLCVQRRCEQFQKRNGAICTFSAQCKSLLCAKPEAWQLDSNDGVCSQSNVKEGGECFFPEQCKGHGKTLTCVRNGDGPGACKRLEKDNGESCDSNGECKSDHCFGGTQTNDGWCKLKEGDQCTSSDDCEEEDKSLECIERECSKRTLKSEGESCTSTSECESTLLCARLNWQAGSQCLRSQLRDATDFRPGSEGSCISDGQCQATSICATFASQRPRNGWCSVKDLGVGVLCNFHAQCNSGGYVACVAQSEGGDRVCTALGETQYRALTDRAQSNQANQTLTSQNQTVQTQSSVRVQDDRAQSNQGQANQTLTSQNQTAQTQSSVGPEGSVELH
jgi:hypothetical protein